MALDRGDPPNLGKLILNSKLRGIYHESLQTNTEGEGCSINKVEHTGGEGLLSNSQEKGIL